MVLRAMEPSPRNLDASRRTRFSTRDRNLRAGRHLSKNQLVTSECPRVGTVCPAGQVNQARRERAVVPACDGALTVLADRFEGKRFNSPNDLVIHPRGWIYFSDPRYVGPEPVEIDHQSVYRYDPQESSLARATTDISKPNGVVISPDGKTLYVAETDNKSLNVDQKPADGTRLRMTLTVQTLSLAEAWLIV